MRGRVHVCAWFMLLIYYYYYFVTGLDPFKKVTLVRQINYQNSLIGAAWPLGSAIDAVSSLTNWRMYQY